MCKMKQYRIRKPDAVEPVAANDGKDTNYNPDKLYSVIITRAGYNDD
jgi:hypothetical protein